MTVLFAFAGFPVLTLLLIGLSRAEASLNRSAGCDLPGLNTGVLIQSIEISDGSLNGSVHPGPSEADSSDRDLPTGGETHERGIPVGAPRG
jgi:hypothetical protein